LPLEEKGFAKKTPSRFCLFLSVVVYEMEKTDKMAVADLIMGIFLIIFGGFVILSSLNMKIYKTFLDAPGFFPFILGIIFVVLGSIMVLSSLRRKGYEQMKSGLKNFKLTSLFKSIKLKRVMTLITFMIIYIFVLIDRINFTLATALYLFFTLYYLKSASLMKIIIISVTTSLLISAFFTRFFHIPLP